jgi:hypothetical protein
MIKVRLCSWGGRNPTWQEQIIIPNLFFWGNSGVKQIP